MNNSKKLVSVCLLAATAMATQVAKAQLSSNPDKFLGNITTGYQVDYGNEKYYTLWNQITPENESKWASIEGTARGSFSWGGCDNAYNYAKNHNFPFKFHCLIWGAQYPGWMDRLSTEEQYAAIVEWMDAIKKHYPNLEMIDVVNEAVAGHQPAPYRDALGGDGKTGYDWIIKAFEMAHERWPNAILIYNDYNTFQWQRTEFITLVKTLRDAGAPIDAYGCQSHDLTDCSVSNFKSYMTEIQNALQIPMYSTEYDIGTSDDALQLQRYKEQIPYMWEADYVAGVTLWGYIYGKTWTTDGNSGLINNGKDRPAMTWLREYMKSDAAKNAKSPFPGMKKEASVYIKPSTITATQGEDVTVTVRAKLATKTIDHVDLYVKGALHATLTEAPFVTTVAAANLGRYDMKAVVVATDGTQYERVGGFTAYKARAAYKGVVSLPGTVQMEDFDSGAEGIAYHDSDTKNEGTNYRTDGTGVDVVDGNGGYAIGYTASGEWLEYTVDVKEAGLYDYQAYASSGTTGSGFRLSLNTENGLKDLTGAINVPQTGNGSWDTYKVISGRTLIALPAGRQIIRLTITGSSCNVDKVNFIHIEENPSLKCTLTAEPKSATVGEKVSIKAEPTISEGTVAKVRFYVDGQLKTTKIAAPFVYEFTPTAKGTMMISAVAIDAEDKQSPIAKLELKVNNKRVAYRTITIPGTFQAANFDKGGEGFTFHDSDEKNEGDAGSYRSDGEGVDLVKGNGGTVIGYTAVGEWLEYTVDVTQAGKYSYTATVSSGVTGSGFKIGLVDGDQVINLANVNVPQTANNDWGTYKTVSGTLSRELTAGKQILRITITGANVNIDKIQLTCTAAAIESVAQDAPADEAIYNLSGQRVGLDYKGLVIKNGKKTLMK